MVRSGYKRTEVGEIPEDWDEARLGEYSIKVGSGITPKGGATVYKEAGRPFVRSQNIGWGDLRLADLAYIDEETHQTFIATEIRNEDVLLNITGASIGRCSVANEQLEGGNVNQHVCIIRTNKELDQKFLSYVLLSSIGQKQIDSFQAGGNREGLNFGQIRSFILPRPKEVNEQKTIANVLSDMDNLIISLKKLIIKKRDIKTATMQQLLTGKTRLPGFGEGKRYKQTELGQIPEDWDVKKISEFTDCTAGGTPSTVISSYWGGDILWMSSGELHLKRVEDVEARITEIGLKNSSTKLIPRYCVLIGLAGQGKTRGTVAVNNIELCTNQSIAAIFPSESHITDFLFYNLESRYEELRSLSTGDGGRGGLNLTIIRNVKIPFPSKDEQLEISNVISDIESELSLLMTRLSKTKSIKQGMVQELLTGRTRLVETGANQLEQERLHGT